MLSLAVLALNLAPAQPAVDENFYLTKALEYCYQDDYNNCYRALHNTWEIMDMKYVNTPFEKMVTPVLIYMYCAWRSGNENDFLGAIDTMENLLIFQFEKE